MNLNETHDPGLESWVESANAPDADFPIQNLPFCMFRHKHAAPRVGVAIGDAILDVPDYQSLNQLMADGRAAAAELRSRLSRVLRADNHYPPRDLLCRISECTLMLPAEIGDYTDFYASIFHATNVGSMFRPDNPLLPNYKYVPIGYHGRASSIVVERHSGASAVRATAGGRCGSGVWGSRSRWTTNANSGVLWRGGMSWGRPFRSNMPRNICLGCVC